jgi:hypothetical protein
MHGGKAAAHACDDVWYHQTMPRYSHSMRVKVNIMLEQLSGTLAAHDQGPGTHPPQSVMIQTITNRTSCLVCIHRKHVTVSELRA